MCVIVQIVHLLIEPVDQALLIVWLHLYSDLSGVIIAMVTAASWNAGRSRSLL